MIYSLTEKGDLLFCDPPNVTVGDQDWVRGLFTASKELEKPINTTQVKEFVNAAMDGKIRDAAPNTAKLRCSPTTFTLSWIVLLLAESQKGQEHAVKHRFRAVHEGTRVFGGVTVHFSLVMLSSDPHRRAFSLQI